MIISVDGVQLFELTDIQKQVMMNDINADIFDEDMKRRLQYIINYKYEQCFTRLKYEWDPKLRQNGISMIPTDPEEYAQLVFSQSNYKDRKSRDLEEAQAQGE